jgi:hypothetical protein
MAQRCGTLMAQNPAINGKEVSRIGFMGLA